MCDRYNILVLIVWISIIITLLITFNFYSRSSKYLPNSKENSKGNLNEHLTLHASIPQDLPVVEMGKNLFETNAFDVFMMAGKTSKMIDPKNEEDKENERSLNDPYAIYIKSSTRDSAKMLMFTSTNVWNRDPREGYNIVALDTSSAELALQIMAFTEDSIGKSTIKSIGKSEFLESGNHAWKSEEKLLFCMFLNENDEKSKEIADAMSIWFIEVFNYLDLINRDGLGKAFPFAKIEGFQMSALFPQKKELTFIYKVVAFDTIVYIQKNGDIMQARKHISDGVIINLQKYYALSSIEPENDENAMIYYKMLGFLVHE